MNTSERKFIGAGIDHRVIESPHNPDVVIKSPRPWNILMRRVCGVGFQEMTEALLESQNRLTFSVVKIPETRLYPTNKGRDYLMFQEKIEEDNSIPDKRAYLLKEGIVWLVARYDVTDAKFISKRKQLYWVDPTPSFLSIFFERFNILQVDVYHIHLARAKNIVRGYRNLLLG